MISPGRYWVLICVICHQTIFAIIGIASLFSLPGEFTFYFVLIHIYLYFSSWLNVSLKKKCIHSAHISFCFWSSVYGFLIPLLGWKFCIWFVPMILVAFLALFMQKECLWSFPYFTLRYLSLFKYLSTTFPFMSSSWFRSDHLFLLLAHSWVSFMKISWFIESNDPI